MRFYFRLKAYFLFSCHSIEGLRINKAKTLAVGHISLPNGPGRPAFFTLYLGELQQDDLGQSALTALCSASFKEQASQAEKEKKRKKWK